MKSKSVSSKAYELLPAFLALQKALDRGCLPHAILLHGKNMDTLQDICFEISSQLLHATSFNIQKHPDFFSVRPLNKMRQINAESIRGLIKHIQHTSHQADQKVVVIRDADRMNLTAANAFLKTLEEPPLDTIIFLLTTRPYSLLDTIRSRCLNFHIPAALDEINYPEWQTWKKNYNTWIQFVQLRSRSKKDIEKQVIEIYKMIIHFEQILDSLSEEQWNQNKKTLPETLTEEEEIAEKTGIFKAIRHHLFKEIEQITYNAKKHSLSSLTVRKLIRVIAELERITQLIELNFNDYTALETFLLFSLKIWAE